MYSLWSDSKDCDACYSACWCVRLCSVYVIMCICTKLEREQEKNLFTHINTHSHGRVHLHRTAKNILSNFAHSFHCCYYSRLRHSVCVSWRNSLQTAHIHLIYVCHVESIRLNWTLPASASSQYMYIFEINSNDRKDGLGEIGDCFFFVVARSRWQATCVCFNW